MHARISIGAAALAAATLLSSAAPAAAQEVGGPVPAPGMIAAGLSTGLVMPSEDALERGPVLAANLDGYLSRRVSARAQLSGAWNDIFGHSFAGRVRPMALTGNLVYNFEGGRWHPFVTAGLGWYHYRFDEDDIDSSANKLGGNVGGGVEFFVRRHDTLTGEVLVHRVGDRVGSSLATYDPNYWSVTFGYKKYWR
jgi:hypothetical protein